jgi:hypothetical protein
MAPQVSHSLATHFVAGVDQDEWSDRPDLANSWALTYEFKDRFDEGLGHYLSGSWRAAREVLEWCRTARTSGGLPFIDVPSEVLLTFMGSHSFRPPQDWRGFRELTEKWHGSGLKVPHNDEQQWIALLFLGLTNRR